MRSKLGLLLALGLLAIAFPDAATLVFETLCMIVSAVMITAAWVEANLSLVCFAGFVSVLLYFFPDTFRCAVRWLGRAVGDAVRTVWPQEHGSTIR
ncbi:hypothetical protein ACIBBE_24665 [Streptomyces sp. NPDC051644]|uniref:hypothetical protein n=1 Tax=Streptomyces sp. NPDC051644 TaxID=3365666 RepID=UPI0037AC9001